MLPRRTLHFTSTEVFWEYHQKTSYGTFPDGFPAGVLYRTAGAKPLCKDRISKSMWKTLVETYSECSLTKSSDRLVAILGLAWEVQLQTKEQYVAGLWRENLELQLCWHVRSQMGQFRDPPWFPYIAPSWSWASVYAPIKFPDMTKYGPSCLNIKVLQVQVKTSGSNTVGNIQNYILRLSCVALIHVTIKILGKGYFLLINGTEIEMDMGLDSTMTDSVIDYFLVMPVQGYGTKLGIIELFLEPTDRKGEFKRAGVFHLTEFEQALEDCANRCADDEYYQFRKGKFGQNHYIINLV